MKKVLAILLACIGLMLTGCKNIENDDPKDSKTRFWKDWSLLKKILYVILNMCTYCIPIILHFILVILKKFLKKK